MQDQRHAKALTLPRYITIAKKCVEHRIPDGIIQRSHFNDLYMLIMSIDISNLKSMIRQKRAQDEQGRGYTTRDISQEDAVKFLGGGGRI